MLLMALLPYTLHQLLEGTYTGERRFDRVFRIAGANATFKASAPLAATFSKSTSVQGSTGISTTLSNRSPLNWTMRFFSPNDQSIRPR
jgi:hypothetical protein